MGTTKDEKITTAISTSPSDESVRAITRDRTANGNVLDDGLQRGLKSRHLQMIAFAGVVG